MFQIQADKLLGLVATTFVTTTLVATGAMLSTSTPAFAHAGESPQVIEVAKQANVIEVSWSATPHDISTLAQQLGVLPESRTFVYDSGQLNEDESDQNDAELLAENPEVLGDYLVSAITAQVDGEACVGTFVSADDLVEKNTAHLSFECAEDATHATIQSAVLQEQGDTYETVFVSAQTKGELAHTHHNAEPVAIEFDASGNAVSAHSHDHDSSSGTELIWVVAGIGVLVLLAIVIALWVRRKKLPSEQA